MRDLTWRAADILIWLDLPFPLVMSRLLRRTIRRALTQEDRWGTGNRESLVRSFVSRQSILLWALKTHRRNRERFAVECGTRDRDKTIVRLRSPRAVERFVAAA